MDLWNDIDVHLVERILPRGVYDIDVHLSWKDALDVHDIIETSQSAPLAPDLADCSRTVARRFLGSQLDVVNLSTPVSLRSGKQ